METSLVTALSLGLDTDISLIMVANVLFILLMRTQFSSILVTLRPIYVSFCYAADNSPIETSIFKWSTVLKFLLKLKGDFPKVQLLVRQVFASHRVLSSHWGGCPILLRTEQLLKANPIMLLSEQLLKATLHAKYRFAFLDPIIIRN